MGMEFEKYSAEYWGVTRARELGVPLERVHLEPAGSFKRGTADDVVSESPPDEDDDSAGFLKLTITRNSILSIVNDADIKAFLQEVAMAEGDFEENRDRISLPIDVSLNSFRLMLEEFEQQSPTDASSFLVVSDESMDVDMVSWKESIFAPELPRLNRIAGNINEMERVFRRVFGLNTKLVTRQTRQPYERSNQKLRGTCTLGSTFLGIDSCLDNAAMPVSTIEIGIEISGGRLDEFLGDGEGLRKAEILGLFLLPLHCAYDVTITSSRGGFTLSDDPLDGRINYSTLLS